MFSPGVLSLLCAAIALGSTSSPSDRAASAATARTRADGPEVVMGSAKRDFGDVFAGEELEQNFPVRNAGTKPLELSQKSTLGARSVAPGYAVRAAVWRPSDDLLLTRTVAARRGAPS